MICAKTLIKIIDVKETVGKTITVIRENGEELTCEKGEKGQSLNCE